MLQRMNILKRLELIFYLLFRISKFKEAIINFIHFRVSTYEDSNEAKVDVCIYGEYKVLCNFNIERKLNIDGKLKSAVYKSE